MKTRTYLLALMLGFGATASLAGERTPLGGPTQIVTAEVVSATPVYRLVEIKRPQRECWDEPVRRYRGRSHGSAGDVLVGGIIGGVIGNQIGKGRGRDAATAIGTLIGAQIGHEKGHGHRHGGSYITYEERCEYNRQVDYEQRLDGYDVTYRYEGVLYNARMPYHPGTEIRLRVKFAPMI